MSLREPLSILWGEGRGESVIQEKRKECVQNRIRPFFMKRVPCPGDEHQPCTWEAQLEPLPLGWSEDAILLSPEDEGGLVDSGRDLAEVIGLWSRQRYGCLPEGPSRPPVP